MLRFWLLLIATGLFSCSYLEDRKTAEEVIKAAIRVHGSSNFYHSKISFDFREIQYSVSRTNDSYTYTRTFVKDSTTFNDVLVNSTDFTRYVDGEIMVLPDSMKAKYSNSVNSVLYFFQLPLVLLDPAANISYKGQVRIKGEPYDAIKVTFSQDLGGEDFQDVFYYWIHKKTHLLDYLAYSYETDGGGVRFREAINRQEVGGILIQDYINFQAPLGTNLADLPSLYQSGKLQEISRITNENIKVKKLHGDEGI